MGLCDPARIVTAEYTFPGALVPTPAGVSAKDVRAYFADRRQQPVAVLDEVSAPLLIIHGDDDEVLPSVSLSPRPNGRSDGAVLTAEDRGQAGHDDERTDEVWSELWSELADFLGDA